MTDNATTEQAANARGTRKHHRWMLIAGLPVFLVGVAVILASARGWLAEGPGLVFALAIVMGLVVLGTGLARIGSMRRLVERQKHEAMAMRQLLASLLLERGLLREEAAAAAVLEERARLAREVHDGLAQHLAFLKMRVAWLRRGPAPVGAEQLEDMEAMLAAALSEARQAITTLRAAPSGSSIADALASYVSEFGQMSNVSVQAIHDASVPEVGPKARVELLRIVQEALSNARRHGHAGHIHVEVRARGNGLEVTVADNGSGFEPSDPEMGHFGIQIMQERAESVNGRLEVRSIPGSGTTVRVWVPVLDASPQSAKQVG